MERELEEKEKESYLKAALFLEKLVRKLRTRKFSRVVERELSGQCPVQYWELFSLCLHNTTLPN